MTESFPMKDLNPLVRYTFLGERCTICGFEFKSDATLRSAVHTEDKGLLCGKCKPKDTNQEADTVK